MAKADVPVAELELARDSLRRRVTAVPQDIGAVPPIMRDFMQKVALIFQELPFNEAFLAPTVENVREDCGEM